MDVQAIQKGIRDNWWQVGLVLLGSSLMVIGIVLAQRQTVGTTLEVIQPSPSILPKQETSLVVDIAGAVEKPGLIRLNQASRIGDVIVAAGGLSATADRSWVARFVNQAEVVRDGMKIYIPEVGEKTEGQPQGVAPTEKILGLVSVNTASESELDGLWGVGVARAKTIIDNRPYNSLSELISKAKLTQTILDKNQGKIGL
jgi:competence protein ComEA